MKKVSMIIADDHPVFRKGLEDSLKGMQEIEKIAHAANGKEILGLLNKNDYHIILMDIRMPEMDGIDATKIVNALYKDVKIIALTMLDDKINILAMFQAGASGYLLKDADVSEIKEAIKQVLSGSKYFSKSVSATLLSKMVEPLPKK